MKTAEEMREHLEQKVSADSEFRTRLLANPKDTLSQELGIVMPESMKVHVHESSLEDVHIALPPVPILNEEELDEISAGLCCCF